MKVKSKVKFECRECGSHGLGYQKYVKCLTPVAMTDNGQMEYGQSVFDEDDYLCADSGYICLNCETFVEHCGYRFETEKDLNNPIIFKTGAEYQFAEKFYMRAGVSSDPVYSTFGFKYLLRDLSIDLAFSIHQVLGLAPHFSVDYTF